MRAATASRSIKLTDTFSTCNASPTHVEESVGEEGVGGWYLFPLPLLTLIRLQFTVEQFATFNNLIGLW